MNRLIEDFKDLLVEFGLAERNADGSVLILASGTSRAKRKSKPKGDGPTPGTLVWEAYLAAYSKRYPAAKVVSRSAATNATCATLVSRYGVEDAIRVVTAYLDDNTPFIVARCHDIALVPKQGHAILTRLQTGTRANVHKPASEILQPLDRPRSY